MKHFVALQLSIGTVGSILALIACGSGSSTPGDTTSTSTTGTTASGSTVTSATSSGSGAGGSSASTTTSSGTGGTPATGICANNTYVVPANMGVGFVDDFETTTNFMGWYSFADVPAGSTTDFSMLAAASPGAAGTTMAGHVSGMNILTGGTNYGAGFGYNLQNASGACADISMFDGVSFWAKGSVGTLNGLEFQAVIAAQKPTNAAMPTMGGDCMLTASNPCYAFPSKTVTLTDTYQQFTVKWTDLAGPVPVNGVILALSWIMPPPAANFDVWIDELALYKGTAPTTAIASYAPSP